MGEMELVLSTITVNGENRMEGLVCWSNYGGNGSLYTQKSGGLGRCLAGHETPRNRPETGCTSVDRNYGLDGA